jgi:hypothetical protein
MLRRVLTGLLAVAIVGPVFAADDAVVELDGLKSKAPAAWKSQKASAMRRYHFKIDKAAGEPEDTEVIVFHFGKGQGGGIDENIKRWKGQFKEPAGERAKLEKFKVGDVQVTLLDIAGTFIFKPPGDPNAKGVEKPDFRAINAIFASPNGPYYINLRGPAKTVETQKKPFEDWLKAFK